MKRVLISLLLWSFWMGAAFAQAPIIGALPYTLQNGQVADANQVMANFNTIVNSTNANAANGGINTNITQLNALTTPLTAAQGGTSLYIGGTSTNVGNAYTIGSPTPLGFTLTAGRVVCFQANAANGTGNVTLNVNSTGATNFYRQTPVGPAAMAGGELQPSNLTCAYYDGTQYQCTTCSTVAPGTVADFSGPIPPPGWTQAVGGTISRANFPALFNALAYTSVSATTALTTSVIVPNSGLFQLGWYVGGPNVTCNVFITAIPDGTHITISAAAGTAGATTLTIGPYRQGDCSTTFHIPNFTGKILAGVDGATNITATTCTNSGSIGDKIVAPNTPCGTQTVALVQGNLPTNNYTPAGTISLTPSTILDTAGSVTGGGATVAASATTAQSATFNGTSTNIGGSGTAVNKLPPISLIYKIIKL